MEIINTSINNMAGKIYFSKSITKPFGKKVKVNKIFDKYTNRPVSINTANKRIKKYLTNPYDLDYPFVLGDNIVYNPYMGLFQSKEYTKQLKDIKKEKRRQKNFDRKTILNEKALNYSKKVKQIREIKNKQTFTSKKVITYPPSNNEKNFGIRRYGLQYNNVPDVKDVGDLSYIFDDIDTFVFNNLKPNEGMGRIYLTTNYMVGGKYLSISTKISSDPSMAELLDKISAILNSDEEFDFRNVDILVKFYDPPEGGAGVEIPKWLKDKSKSVHFIINADNLCGQRCLVLGMANKDRKAYLKRKPELFTKDTKALCSKIKVKGRMTFLDFDKFVEVFPQYKISVASDLNNILYETDNKDYDEEIWLYYDKRLEHYHLISNINGFMNKDSKKSGKYKFCSCCRKTFEYRSYDKHSCSGLKCNLCGIVFETKKEKDEHMSCPKSDFSCKVCNLKCRGDECLEFHQNGNGKRKGCRSKQWFFPCCMKEGYGVMNCWGRQEDKEIHKCDHAFCKTCDEYKPRTHRCWIKGREHKDKGLVSLIAFDFESFIDDDTGEHIVNYIVAKERGTNQIWKWKYTDGKDILKEFIDFVFTKPKTTFIAHNGKAYDTWLIHYHLTKHYNERPNKIILAGQKIMYMEIKSIKFIDSLNHFACRLEQVPKTFGLDENQFKKGFYPYLFNNKDNWNYIGEIPDIKYFDPCSMSVDKRSQFFSWWYDKHNSKYIWNHIKETDEYCVSDVNILLQGCNVYSQEGMDLVGIDPLEKQTIASWVMDLYMKNFYDFSKTPICVLYKNEYDFIRRSFHGGRTETFRLYRKWDDDELKKGICGRYKDIQSLYPSTQYYDELPIGEPEWVGENIPNPHEYIHNNYGWYEVDITMNKDLFIPPLVAKGEGKLTADLHDKEKKVFHSVELLRAVECGCVITKIHQGLIMKTSTELFKNFVKKFLEVKVNATGKPKFWNNKRDKDKWIKEHEDRFGFTPKPTEKNPGKRAIAKMILNSLWGKFGQRPDMPKNLYIMPNEVYKWWKMLKQNKKGDIEIKGEELSGESLFVSYLELKEDKNDVLKSTSLAIASSITASATMRLYKELNKLQERVLYCDTDSIIYEHDPKKYNIPDGEYLGEWECETDGLPITEFVSTGAKSYAYKVKGKVKDCKMKGITLNWENCKDVNFNTLKKLVDEDITKITTKQNIRFDKNKNKGITTFKMCKDIKFTMDKREVVGYKTYPFGYKGIKINV